MYIFFCFFLVWCLDLSVWCLDLSVWCLELSFGCLDSLSDGCLDLSVWCLDLSAGNLDFSDGFLDLSFVCLDLSCGSSESEIFCFFLLAALNGEKKAVASWPLARPPRREAALAADLSKA